MITVTDIAAEKVKELIEAEGEMDLGASGRSSPRRLFWL